MLVIEFVAGPGSGKTTLATGLFCSFKQFGASGLDFAREAAQDYINKGCSHKLNNQLNIVAKEYERLCTLRNNGCKVLITDTSLNLCKIYGQDFAHQPALLEMIKSIRSEFEFKTIFVERVKPYIAYGRSQNEDQAKELDLQIWEACGPYAAKIPGSMEGLEKLKAIALTEGWMNSVLPNHLNFVSPNIALEQPPTFKR